ncbi:PIN domain-containing protein [Streptomyces rhizosphaerihabitans]|uniref:PIN domain-containing protein n=1 Tax=Streptomyces rhizosphaerihabitans TaxID=1266770 RepID=UPI0021BE1D15|nr:PIN domain-containing protein [Streptomyces rhizosphaerihabitans]MCT9010328.1 hypothetical protein [Streptomyces rhizosphaerihabitans]
MVVEELAAQKAVKYRQKHEAAAHALNALAAETPWNECIPLGPCDLDRVREHWRTRYASVADELPTSETAMREALFREANALLPCKATEGGKSLKVGARDAAIWLSAVEYARTHPTETVYFVSSNTRDFGDGSTYSFPMDKDVAGLGDRFVHLTSMDEVIARFTKTAETDETMAVEILSSPNVLKAIKKTAKKLLRGEPFDCIVQVGGISEDRTATGTAELWLTAKASLRSVDKVQGYRIGDHEWFTAVVRWDIGGTAFLRAPELTAVPAGCSWTTTVIFRPDPDDPRITVLRHDAPRVLSTEDFTALNVSKAPTVTAAALLATIQSFLTDDDWRRIQRSRNLQLSDDALLSLQRWQERRIPLVSQADAEHDVKRLLQAMRDEG